MSKNLSLILKIIALIVFVLSCLWSYFSFGFEPVIAAFVSFGSFIGLWIADRVKNNKGTITQNQRSGNNSANYQAGGDININHKSND
jgi:hypothetical protein